MTKADIRKLGTERRNRSSNALDTKSALQIARIINAEDAKVARAVKKVLPQVEKAIDTVAQAIGRGGRLIYVGAGTSGRIAALDASECPPTFNTDPDTVQYVMAGGERALAAAAEFNEDSREDGRRDIAARNPGSSDVVAGLAASGRTPYTIAAVEYAKSRGAKTVAITCNKKSELGRVADIEIAVDVGPEVVSGSTRMKAGTAQKLVCNMITTGAMTRLGYIYGNLMVNVHPTNEKLVERALNILMTASGADRKKAEQALDAAGRRVQVALVMLKRKVTAAEAERRLRAASGHVRKAIEGKV
jgi:N-acetylmuramic acid 6-phosphate etherase